LDFDSRHTPPIHLHNRETEIAVLETFAAAWNESELVQHKAADGGIGGIFGQSDVVLRIEIAHVESGIEDYRAVGQRQGPLFHVELVVNFANHLLENVFQRHQTQDAAELVDHQRKADAASAQLEQQLVGWLGFRNDQQFSQNSAQIEGRWRNILFHPPFTIEQHPKHVLDVHEAKNLIFGSAIHRDPRFLGGCKSAHHLVQRRFHGKNVHIRPRHHDLAHLHLSQLDGADNEFFLAGRQQTALARLLNLDL